MGDPATGDGRPLSSGARLAAVRRARHDSTGWRPIIDHVVELTAAATGMPVALASFVTADHQAVLACVGLDGIDGGYEVPLAQSLCGHVVASGLPLIVADAAADDELAASDAVRRHGLRGYAGFPIRDDGGHVLAVIAVADHRPVTWTTAAVRNLDHAASVFTALMTGAHAADVAARSDAQRQRAFLDALLESLDTGVAACDERGRLVLFNRALRDFLTGGDGYEDSPPEEWADRFHVSHPDGRPFAAAEMPLVRALHGQVVRSDDQIIPDRHGRPRRYAVNATPITDRDGVRLGAVAAVHDVTDQRRAERFRRCELAVTRALSTLADLSDAGRAILAAVGETLGWPYAELWLYDPLTDVMRPAAHWSRDGAGHGPPMPTHLRTGAGLAGAAWAEQQPVWVEDAGACGLLAGGTGEPTRLRAAVVVPIRTGGDVYGALTLFSATAERPSDALSVMLAGIAAQFGQHLEYRRAEDLTLQLARSKDEYIRLVGHELRTPLTSIASYTSLLTDFADEVPAGARDLLTAITRNSDRLRRIIDALLDLAALDSGHATMHVTRCDLADVFRGAVADAAADAGDWPVRLHATAPEHVLIDGDAARLRFVVETLLHNAITYSHPGGDVTATLTEPDHHVTLTVTDAGIGIPADELEQVFDRFHRSSRVRDLGIPGTGLGLPASRLIVHRHHGTISLRPTPGGGVTATVRLPTP